MTLTVYAHGENGRISAVPDGRQGLVAGGAVWIDLHNPTDAEEALVEATLEIDVPTANERAALEESTRFYEDGGAAFFTATVLARRPDGTQQRDAITFILARSRLITFRTCKPKAFEIGKGRASARIEGATSAASVFMALVEGLIERHADLLGDAVGQVELVSESLLQTEGGGVLFNATLKKLARLGAQASQCRDSLGSIGRMCRYAQAVADRHGLTASYFKSLAHDVDDLERQAESLSNDLTFMLDATLGLVNVEQNGAMKTMAGVTLFFLPPTLIASIFGMNFEHMSVFVDPLGAWFAVAMMLAASFGILILARARKWL